jgi:3-hydroxyacyl-[acyl-carrier-protein] dehydratase
MLQATAGDKVPVLTRVDNAKFKQMVRPGDSVTLEAEIVEVISLAIYLKGKVKVNGKVSVTFDFACSLAPRSV